MCLYLPVSTNERANPCSTSLFNPCWSLHKTVHQPYLNKNAHREIFYSNGKKNFLKRERVNPFLAETCWAVTVLVQHEGTVTGLRWPLCTTGSRNSAGRSGDVSHRVVFPWLWRVNVLQAPGERHFKKEGRAEARTSDLDWNPWCAGGVTRNKRNNRASLLAQWLRIHLPMQGTRVQALVREDPTGCGATKLMSHNYWPHALKPARCNYWACVLQPLKPAHLEPVLRNKRSHRNEKPAHRNEE